jgi:small subunit ribosomal protein S20
MPIIKSAKKKMRKDKVRTLHNTDIKNKLKGLLKSARRSPDPKILQELQSALDKAVKTKLIHANKAARLKSRLSKGTSGVGSATKKSAKKKLPVKKTSKKS